MLVTEIENPVIVYSNIESLFARVCDFHFLVN